LESFVFAWCAWASWQFLFPPAIREIHIAPSHRINGWDMVVSADIDVAMHEAIALGTGNWEEIVAQKYSVARSWQMFSINKISNNVVPHHRRRHSSPFHFCGITGSRVGAGVLGTWAGLLGWAKARRLGRCTAGSSPPKIKFSLSSGKPVSTLTLFIDTLFGDEAVMRRIWAFSVGGLDSLTLLSDELSSFRRKRALNSHLCCWKTVVFFCESWRSWSFASYWWLEAS
jgi:hypothetical protein